MGFESAKPNKVLVLTILNASYPVDADVIYQISNSQGKVLRVAVLQKPQLVQALVEFDSIESAQKAKHAMNGADIYSGCCTLKVEFAKVLYIKRPLLKPILQPDHVRVTRQDKDQRDYTLPDSLFFLPHSFISAPPFPHPMNWFFVLIACIVVSVVSKKKNNTQTKQSHNSNRYII